MASFAALRMTSSDPNYLSVMPKFYLTTAIDYSNGDPHLGHALEKVGADCIARYRRVRGDQVHFLMGMDEHAQAVIQAAEQNGQTPQAWVDLMALRFADFWRRLEVSNDDWIRTTEPRHRETVTELLRRIQRHNPGDLYIGDYEGLYCTGCEEFKQPAQIVDGRCIEHPTLELVRTKERNHFFRLSRYRDTLLELITSGRFKVEPAIRRNEIVRLLKDGLQDISVSRQRLSWGIPFPDDPDQTVYVWFDALINYLSATGFPADGYQRLWPADLHIVGKGITRFHCVIWPAMLLAAEEAIPSAVWAHGYVQWEGTKMSKTAGHRGHPGRGDRPARPRRAPVFPAPRSGLRGRRELQLGAVRRALHRRPGRRARQPGLALAGDDREVPRGRDPGAGHGHHARPGRTRGDRAVRARRWTRTTCGAARRRRGIW